MKHNILTVTILAAFLALSGCGGGSSTPSGPTQEEIAAEAERMALAAARTAAMTAAGEALAASNSATAAVQAIEGQVDAASASYEIAKQKAEDAKVASDAAQAANEMAQSATTSADAVMYQAEAERQRNLAQAALTDTQMYAEMTPKVLHDLAGNGLFTATGASFADDSRNPTSGNFADSTADNTEYSPLTTAISRDSDENVSAIATDFYVTSISNTGAGLEINYMVGGEARAAIMTDAECYPDPDWLTCEKDGAYLWSMTTMDPREFDQGDGYDHMEIQHIGGHGHRAYYLFGVNPQTLPTGRATYAGSFRADAYKMTSTSNDQRVRYTGNFLLSANFDMSELDGRIYSIRGSQPGQSSYRDRVSWPTSWFTITDGRIVNGQFTAVLTAGDSDPNTPFNDSVRGYMGHILGEFFGPNAEEVGAVVSASRDVAGEDHDYVLYGYVGGTDFGPAKTLGSEGLVTGLLRDLDTNTSALREDGTMATVQRTDNGWTVTVGDRTVEFQDTDYASHPDSSRHYVRAIDGGEAWFGSETGGLGKSAEFDHFDVKIWSYNDQVSGGNYSGVSTNDFIVHGDRTPGSAMPTSGTATYGGRMEARTWPTDAAPFTSSDLVMQYLGDVALTVDFANSGVTGDFTIMQSRIGLGSYSPATGGATFDAAINGNLFSADNLNGTGDFVGYQNGNVNGAFFGPSAEEAAGVFNAQDQTANRVLSGWFGTTKDDE